MQQTVDRMLADQGQPVGTSGGATVAVSRERLEQLRSQIETLIASLNAR
jgi:hypothetical protein